MQLEKNTIAILKHLGTFATSIHIEPSDPQIFIVSSDNRQIVALAKNIQSFDQSMAIYNIKNFVSALELFKDTEFDLEIFRDHVEIKSNDGVFNQEFMLSDPAILVVPKPDKAGAYFSSELPVEFELSDAFLTKVKSGVNLNVATHVLFETIDGQIVVRAANVSSDGRIEKTTNQFSVKTGVTTGTKFRVGIPASLLTQIAPGNYKTGISKNFVRFLAPEDAFVSYVIPTAKFSTLEA
ncbi:DNA polymerase processivity factor [Sinorhizobium phage phiM9]|uniref:Sliding clamp DNA polymerase accessory protein n=1 Tax=Sinorhizobium phage phiM9 TaxID=1636182 RepID=A0A0F6R560_9CAUD|nr:DNA polymerase processivity factor [Sinorhizobium phage phiM9]AKE44877.1 sliding clamp DNA polymerase accessory protein [Sinorhizobium phage phiM9]